MSKILSLIHFRKNISIVFAAAYITLICSIAQAASSQNTSSSHHLDLKSTIAQSQCSLWNVGKFTAIQSNTSEPLRFNLVVHDRGENNFPNIVGTAKYGTVFGEVLNAENTRPILNSTVLSFQVRWNNGATGMYQGTIDSNGYLSGDTYNVANTSSRATWAVRKPFQCLR
jgi:hypothetical protein